jgi:hypothetical protein
MADPENKSAETETETGFKPTMKRLEELAAEAGPWTDEDEEFHRILTAESDAH